MNLIETSMAVKYAMEKEIQQLKKKLDTAVGWGGTLLAWGSSYYFSHIRLFECFIPSSGLYLIGGRAQQIEEITGRGGGPLCGGSE
jgi:hypothetical protein